MTTKVDLFYDLVDKAAMIFYNSLKSDYLEALIQVSNSLTNNQFDSKLRDEDIKELENIYKDINKENFYNEEIRLAFELLIVKAFKHVNYSLNFMTPDTINYLLSNIVLRKFKDKNISILDTALGSANMLQAISNHYKGETKLYGIEINDTLLELAKASSNLQANEIVIYYQDALKEVYDVVDLVVGDLDSYFVDEYQSLNSLLYKSNVRYFPYLVFEARLNNIRENGYFIYIIENDFFSQEKNTLFKKYIQDKVTLMGLIVLPKTMFKDNYIGKSILIGKKAVLKSFEMMILEIPSLDKNTLKSSLQKLNIMIDNI